MSRRIRFGLRVSLALSVAALVASGCSDSDSTTDRGDWSCITNGIICNCMPDCDSDCTYASCPTVDEVNADLALGTAGDAMLRCCTDSKVEDKCQCVYYDDTIARPPANGCADECADGTCVVVDSCPG